jgi:hypothetical protein
MTKNDKSVHVPGGIQRLTTLDGYFIHLTIKDGLACRNIQPHTGHEFVALPHVFLTSKFEWDHTVQDHEFTMNYNGERTILPLSTSFLPLRTMHLVKTVIALKLISMRILHVLVVTILITIRNCQTKAISAPSLAGWMLTSLRKLLSIQHNTRGTALSCVFRSPNPTHNIVF